MKILVTDASPALCRLLCYYLNPLGAEIHAASSPDACLEEAINLQPDLITLGMELGEKTGIDLCEELKRHDATRLTPIVIISASAEHELQVRAFEAGAMEYIVKPCSPEYLRQRVESILERSQATPEISVGDSFTVLVAEDSRAIMSLYKYLLGNLGCDVIECLDGQEAWKTLQNEVGRVDLVISDIHMPHMDGREFARHVREDARFAQIPLIMSSTVREMDEIKALLSMGANDYVTKPFSHEEFVARVQAHLRTRELMREQQEFNRKLSRMNEILEDRVRQRTKEIREANISAIYMLAIASESKDKDTGNHIQRVRFYSEALAKKLGYGDAEAEEVGYSSMMHDVGKLAIPDRILKKPGRLDDDELKIMRTHAEEGARILGDNSFFAIARDIAHCHHERFDGTGYPRGLVGAEIPLAARMVAVADIFDALSSVRVYKPAWKQEDVLVELVTMAGTHLDPKVVDAFLELVNDGSIDRIRATYSDQPSGADSEV